MKRMLSALMAILLLLGCMPVLADGSIYSGMPQGVQEYLIQSMRIAGFTIDGHIRPAGGDTTFLMAGDILFLWVASIPLGYLAGLKWGLPSFWIYTCLKIDQIIKCVWCYFRLRSGKWLKKIKGQA